MAGAHSSLILAKHYPHFFMRALCLSTLRLALFKNRLPTRSTNHTSESFSYKVFSRAIPNHWIIRDLSERDYGIDVLIEYVTDDNEVTGKLAAIQLKSTSELSFNKDNEWRFYKVKPSTTDYWLNSNIPAFIFFVSEDEDIFFLSVNDYVKRNYDRYLENENFYYGITPENRFSVKEFVEKYESVYASDVSEMALININYLYEDFYSFFMENYKRDELMILDSDDERLNQIDLLSYRLSVLSKEVSIKWTVTSLDEIVVANNYKDELCEFHLSMFMDELDKQMQLIIKGLLIRIAPYIHYWFKKDPYFVKFLVECDKDLLKNIRWKSIQAGRGIPVT
ncbi:DUF4365 domain-containing protein [Pseudoalteromonas sp. JC28]|uniref:DUF4365 domain-containing protein n=1 Tax=Pseudoalteromonas sp. JC28 TaxID=2267617 RepID=UPI0015749C6C|nr:DUF4365 domain-containing protein [Pseudoalteromonas sp. JC28]